MKTRLLSVVMFCITLVLVAGCHQDEVEPYVGTREARLAGATSVVGSKLGPMPGVFTKVYFNPYYFTDEQTLLDDEVVREWQRGQFKYWPRWSGYRYLASTRFQVEPDYQTYWLIGSLDTYDGAVGAMMLVIDVYDRPYLIAAYY